MLSVLVLRNEHVVWQSEVSAKYFSGWGVKVWDF